VTQINRIQWSKHNHSYEKLCGATCKPGITIYSESGFVARLENQDDRNFFSATIVQALKVISAEQQRRLKASRFKSEENSDGIQPEQPPETSGAVQESIGQVPPAAGHQDGRDEIQPGSAHGSDQERQENTEVTGEPV
jgi:hypothetical protein